MKMKNLKTMLSSKDMTWETPQDFFDTLDLEFNFTLDACATKENAKCERYFTPEIDGLKQDWQGQNVFCNPPYGSEIKHWVKKCYTEGQKPETLVVMLIPARTNTNWFHDYCLKYAEIRFLRGRPKFGGAKYGLPQPLCIVIFNNLMDNK